MSTRRKLMRAARLHGYGDEFVIESVLVPDTPAGGALVRIAGSGVCRSDIDVRYGRRPIIEQFPWILGHENAGYIESLGRVAESGFEIGEAVAVFGGWGCGGCWWCRNGLEHLCDLRHRCGSGRQGGYAEFLAVPSTRHLVPLGDLDPAWAAPLTDAAVTPYRAVRKVVDRLYPGSLVVVIGIGGLGQFAVQYLSLFTAATIIAIDKRHSSRERAMEAGAYSALSPQTAETTYDDALEHLGTERARAVIDFVGSDESLALAARLCGRGSTIVLVGLAGGSLEFRYDALPPETHVMTSTWGSRRDIEDVISLARQSRISIEVEHHPLEAINSVFNRLEMGGIRGRAVLVP